MKKNNKKNDFPSISELERYEKMQLEAGLCKLVFKKSKNKSFYINASPTFSYASHDKWASRHVCALNAVHDIHPATVCGTINFKDGTKETISDFLSTYAKKIRYEASKTNGKNKSALFGVIEIRTYDLLIHMHWLARNFEVNFLAEHIQKFNKKHKTKFNLSYYDVILNLKGASAYPFKFGHTQKLIFTKGALQRYVFHCGNYFLKNKKQFQKNGFDQYILQKKANKIEGITLE